eukprot:2379529-Alexandrium_andersonii.AAC.1
MINVLYLLCLRAGRYYEGPRGHRQDGDLCTCMCFELHSQRGGMACVVACSRLSLGSRESK